MADIFEIVGKFAINGADKAKKEINDVTSTGEKSSSKLGKVMGGMGKLASTAGKAVGAGLLAGGTAIVALGKQAVSAYGEYEQLVGGVETLFKESADTVIENSARAYKTAGMSANEYMSTVTSFSASLLQSLGGDTVEAAAYADRAVTDMSDNANKMGTSMEMIQNAYNGFAKQNYTMLDNLKLGYGGTKTEMERLIADASKMTDIQKELGVTVDANSMSFGNVVNAISVMQKSLGITGTTAKEASSTIQGSISSMKGAWTNLLTGLSDDTQNLDLLIDNFIESVGTVGSNLLPRLEVVFKGIAKLISDLAPELINQVNTILPTVLPIVTDGATQIVNAIIQSLPGIIDAVIGITPQLIDAIMQITNSLVGALPQILQSILLALPTLMPQLIDGVVNLVIMLVEMLPQIIQPIIDNLPLIITSIVDALVNNLPILIEGLIALILALVEALPEIMQVFYDATPTVISKIVEALITAIPQLLAGIVQIIMAIGAELPALIGMLAQGIVGPFVGIFSGLWNGVKTILSNVIGSVVTWAQNFATKAKEAGTNFVNNIVNFVKTLPGKIQTWLTNTISKVTTFANNMATKAKDAGTKFINNIINTIKELPSKVQTLLTNVINRVTTFATNMATKAKEAGTNFVNNIMNAIKALPGNIANFCSNVIAKITAFASQMKSKALEAGRGFATTLINALKAIPGQMASIGRSIVDGIWGGISSAWSGLTSKVSSLKTNLVQGFKSAFNINSPSRVMRDEVGMSIGEGIGDGILRSYDKLKGVVNTWCGKVINGFKNALGIHSPSRVTRDDVGKPLVEGIAVGIKENSDTVSNEFQRMLNDLKLKRDLDVINDAEYYAELEKLRNNYLKKGTSDWWQYTKDIIDYEKELGTQEKELIDETTEYLTSSYEEHIKKREDLTSGFLQEISKTKLYDLEKVQGVKLGVKYEYEAPKLKDWDFELERLDKFESRILDVQNRLTGVFSGDDEGLQSMLNTIRKDPFGEGGKVLYAMFESTQEELEKFANGYREYIEKTNSVTRNVYSDDLKKLDQNFVSDVINTFRNNPEIEKIKTFGQNIVEKIVDGIKSKGGWLKEQLDELCDIIANNLVFDMVFTDGKVELVNSRLANNLQPSQIKTNNNTNTINENIDRLISLIGEYLPGIADKMDRPITVDGDSLAVGMTRKIDSQLGKLTIAKGRGNV